MDLRTTHTEDLDGTNTVEGDLYVDESGQLVGVEGAEEEAQAIEVRLSTLRNEWFLDLTQGMPWREEVLARKGVGSARVVALVRSEILQREAISGVPQVEVTQEGRELSIGFVAQMADGEPVEGAVGVVL